MLWRGWCETGKVRMTVKFNICDYLGPLRHIKVNRQSHVQITFLNKMSRNGHPPLNKFWTMVQKFWMNFDYFAFIKILTDHILQSVLIKQLIRRLTRRFLTVAYALVPAGTKLAHFDLREEIRETERSQNVVDSARTSGFNVSIIFNSCNSCKRKRNLPIQKKSRLIERVWSN